MIAESALFVMYLYITKYVCILPVNCSSLFSRHFLLSFRDARKRSAQSSEKDLNDFGGASGDREDEGDAKMTEDVATTEWGDMQRKLGNWKPLTKKKNTNDERNNNKTLWFPRVEKRRETTMLEKTEKTEKTTT